MYVDHSSVSTHQKRILDEVRATVRKDWYRIGTVLLLTIIHDVAGLFSASGVVSNLEISFLDDTYERFLVIYAPIVICDMGSEMLLLFAHDYPLSHKRYPINWLLTYIGLVGQILTSLAWLSLGIFIIYNAIANNCPSHVPITQCKALAPGISETVTIIIVWAKNSLTLKAFKDRAGLYPIILEEQFMFLWYIRRGQASRIIDDYKKANNIPENADELVFDEDEDNNNNNLGEKNVAEAEKTKESIFDSQPFIIASNFAVLCLFDFAALASVTNLITDEPEFWKIGTKALGFVSLIVIDIISEAVILIVHDWPLVTAGKSVHYMSYFNTARLAQLFCLVAWAVTLACMVWRAHVAFETCGDTCADCVYNTTETCFNDLNCEAYSFCNTTTSLCFYNASNPVCSISNRRLNNTITWNVNPELTVLSNITGCDFTQTRLECLGSKPSSTNCVLLLICFIDNAITVWNIFLRSFVYPITIPESAMFQVILYWKGKMKSLKHKTIISAIGKMEYGLDWQYDESVHDCNKSESNPSIRSSITGKQQLRETLL